MKNKQILISVIFLLFAGLTALQAQKLYVKENSGTQTEYSLSEIRKLTFPAGSITVHETSGNTDTYSVSGLRYLNFTDLSGPGPGPGPVSSVPAMSPGKLMLLTFLFMLLGAAYLALRKKRQAGRLLSFLLLISLATGAAQAQSNKMFIMRNGAVYGTHEISNIDSAIFYNPSGANDTLYILNGTTVEAKYKMSQIDSAIFYEPAGTDVYNPATGKTWMDRNLGAGRVATSSTDAQAYGDLYQWGRGTDGHEKRTSGTTSTLSTSDTPGHGNFIVATNSPYDWRSPQNTNLWQGVNGVNNPCPVGYRLPTAAEWEAERQSWGSNNTAGAFASPLKLPLAGRRFFDGSLDNVGSYGSYWSSTVSGNYDGTYSQFLSFHSDNAGMIPLSRADGRSVRCLKD